VTRLAGIKRGRMSAEEKAAIERLAAALKKPTPGAIARKLKRHPATVAWYMISHGLIERTIRYGGKPRVRPDGIVQMPWTREQDLRLLELRAAGTGFPEIAERLTREFNIPRNHHGARIRCIMLAAYDGAPELGEAA
jgi:hypothetical protein